MYVRVMGVGVATLLISAMKIIGDLEVLNKLSIPAIITLGIGAIIILATREGCEDELEKEYKHSTSYHNASYPSYLNRK